MYFSQLSHIASSSQPLSVCMRTLEVYLDADLYENLLPGSDVLPRLLLYVVQKGKKGFVLQWYSGIGRCCLLQILTCLAYLLLSGL